MFKNILRNWKTTAAGAGLAANPIIDGINEHNPFKIIGGILILLLGAFAKDADKTGLSN